MTDEKKQLKTLEEVLASKSWSKVVIIEQTGAGYSDLMPKMITKVYTESEKRGLPVEMYRAPSYRESQNLFESWAEIRRLMTRAWDESFKMIYGRNEGEAQILSIIATPCMCCDAIPDDAYKELDALGQACILVDYKNFGYYRDERLRQQDYITL
jgi:hypothetical protein